MFNDIKNTTIKIAAKELFCSIQLFGEVVLLSKYFKPKYGSVERVIAKTSRAVETNTLDNFSLFFTERIIKIDKFISSILLRNRPRMIPCNKTAFVHILDSFGYVVLAMITMAVCVFMDPFCYLLLRVQGHLLLFHCKEYQLIDSCSRPIVWCW